MKILERQVEGPVLRWAKKRRLKVRKMNGQGNRGWPDRMYMIPGGRPRLHEYKRPGGKPTRLQAHTINELKELGYEVEVFDNADAAIRDLEEALETARLSKESD